MDKHATVVYTIPHGELDFVRELERRKITEKISDWHLETVKKYNQIKNLSKNKTCRDYVAIFERWNKLHEMYNDKYFLKGITSSGDLLASTWRLIEKTDVNVSYQLKFYQKNNLHKAIGSRWNVIVLNSLWVSLRECEVSHFEFMIFYYKFLITGHFDQIDRQNGRFGTTYMLIKFNDKYDMLIGLLPERYPIYHKSQETIDRYKYRQVLKVFKLSAGETVDRLYSRYLYKHRMSIKNDANRGTYFHDAYAMKHYIIADLTYEERYFFTLNNGRGAKIYEPSAIDYEVLNMNTPIYVPIDFRISCMNNEDERILVSNDAKFIMDLNQNQEMVINFFEKLEEIGIVFSESQRKMLTSNENTMVLGRSGTGKTTISAFKIIALDLLFMAYKKRFVHNKKTFQLTLEDFKTMTGCITVFCTASPVLTNEVKRFYNELIDTIKNFLRKRQEKLKARKLEREAKEAKEKEEIGKEVEIIESVKDSEESKTNTEKDEVKVETEEDESFNAFDD